MAVVVKPLIHLNGSSARSLYEQYTAAGTALYAALEKLEDSAPNQRDYYPYPDADAKWNMARAEHQLRLEAIQSVIDELAELAEHVSEFMR